MSHFTMTDNSHLVSFLYHPFFFFKIKHVHLRNAAINISLELGSESVLRNQEYFWLIDLMGLSKEILEKIRYRTLHYKNAHTL